ncbi:phytanoyl-CoA dioxygenase family protein [Candidatus Pelagibacter bacterium]|nr:phytanoyl-CoA dioxygenase family protein [Candidatus Pelagibacter bacterium]
MDYKIFKNTISKKSSDKLFDFILKCCHFYCPSIFSRSEKFKDKWDDHLFNTKLILFRKKNKKKFSAMYNSIQISNEIAKFVYTNNFSSIAKKTLKVQENELLVRAPGLRMDFPNDTRNSYGWHQDNAYDQYNLSSKNGIVIWSPLIDTDFNNGTLIIKKGSYNHSFSSSRLEKTGSNLRSKQILVKKKYLKKYNSETINVKKNSSVVIYSGLFHKSGKNISDKVRFTVLIRFNKLLSKDFKYFRNL